MYNEYPTIIRQFAINQHVLVQTVEFIEQHYQFRCMILSATFFVMSYVRALHRNPRNELYFDTRF